MAGGTVDTGPFNRRLVEGKRLGRHAPSWKVAGEVGPGYRLRRVALPWPGGERDLGLAVSHLHSLRFFAELLGSLGRTNEPRSAPRIPRGPRCLLNGADASAASRDSPTRDATRCSRPQAGTR